MNLFTDALKETLATDCNQSLTENGAIGYRTSGRELLDMNFAVSSLRSKTEQQITEQFIRAFYENRLLAVKWLFYVRDIREGMGERHLFRVCLYYLAERYQDMVKALLPLIPEYGRYDDLLCLLNTPVKDAVIALIREQLARDWEQMEAHQPISLLGKWLPSANASSPASKWFAHLLIKELGLTNRQYRKLLASLRAYLSVVEVNMSRNAWQEIDYETVPSRANLLYREAFLRNDLERRSAYLAALQQGSARIHAGVLFPHDIVHRYLYRLEQEDATLEELWKALPDFAASTKADPDLVSRTICVADGSGSMLSRIGGTDLSARDVANALALYFAERCSGPFHNRYLTFSEHPQLVDVSGAHTLREKLELMLAYQEVANTNIEAVFDLILRTAVTHQLSQKDLPHTILILSDMEFDACVRCGDPSQTDRRPTKKLFDVLAERYARHGYRLPRLAFWNIHSRTGTIPVIEHELGVALVSGFSPAALQMVLRNTLDPWECLVEQLQDERYQAVEEAVRPVL